MVSCSGSNPSPPARLPEAGRGEQEVDGGESPSEELEHDPIPLAAHEKRPTPHSSPPSPAGGRGGRGVRVGRALDRAGTAPDFW